MAFRAAVVLILMSSKMPSFQYFLYLREQKKVTGGMIRWIGRVFQHSYFFSKHDAKAPQCYVKRPLLAFFTDYFILRPYVFLF